nr:MAG: hypothetical protein DIU70_11925 [Bacillota bacterium]
MPPARSPGGLSPAPVLPVRPPAGLPPAPTPPVRPGAPRVAPALLALLLACGCARNVGPAGPPPAISPVPRPALETVVLYFPHQSRPVLVREVRQAVRRGEFPEEFALRELLKGPRRPDARPLALPDPAPAEATGGAPEPVAGPSPLLVGKVIDGTLSLYLSPEAREALARSGSLLDIYALVNTAAQFNRVERVAIRFMDGGTLPVEGLAGTPGPLYPRRDLVDSAPAEEPPGP